jgi:4-hydroxybenzoate polyprenyltransferase
MATVEVELSLYAAALGLIPALLSFAYDRRVFHQTVLGNRFVAGLILLCAAIGFIGALVVLIKNKPTPELNVAVVVGIVAPAVAIFARIASVVFRKLDVGDPPDSNAQLVPAGREMGDARAAQTAPESSP